MSLEALFRFLLGRPDPKPLLSIEEIARIGRQLSTTPSGAKSIVFASGGVFAVGSMPAVKMPPLETRPFSPALGEFLGLPFLRVGEPDPRLESMLRDLS